MIRHVATASPSPSAGPRAPHRRTFLGLERQGAGWTLVIAAITLLLAVGLPIADSAIATEDAALAGSVTDIGLGVRITPAAGWRVVSQPDDRAHQAQFTRAGALVTIRAAPYSGSAEDAYVRLAATIDAESGVQIASDPQTVTTATGLVGVVTAFAGSAEQGFFAVFVSRRVLAVVIAESPLAAFPFVADDMASMIGTVEIRAAGR
jgi:hypothetical protein